LSEHYLEHAQFVQIFQSRTPPIFIPDYNYALWGDDKKVISAWLEAHEAAHEALRDHTGVSGIDLSDVDLSQDDQFFDWMDSHAAEHADIRAALRII
jgi:glycogen debranching enzyme